MKDKPMRRRAVTDLATADQDNGPIDEDKQAIRLGFLIHDVSRMRRTAYDQLMKPLGVTRAQWWILAHLSRNDGMMQTKLAGALDVGKASLGAILEKLESVGLIERCADPIDKRAKRVYMARAGHQLLKKMTLEESRFNKLILRALPLTDRESMIRQLVHIKHALSEHTQQPASGDSE